MAMKKKNEAKTAEEIYREERKQRISKSGKSKISEKTKKVIKSLVAVIVVCGLLTAYVATGAVRGGLLSFFSVPQKTLNGLVITDGETEYKMSVAQYNYYYSSVYNGLYNTVNTYTTYGLDPKTIGFDVDFDLPLKSQVKETNAEGKEVTWEDYVEEQILEKVKTTEIYYAAAVAANDGKEPDLTEEKQKEIDDAFVSYQESADKYGYTLDAYLKKAMGRGLTEKLARQEMKKSTIAQTYQTSLEEEVDALTFTEEQVQAHYQENKASFDFVDAYVFEAADEAAAISVVEKLNSNEDYGTVISNTYSENDAYKKEAYKDGQKSLSKFLMRADAKKRFIALSAEGLDWLYSADRTTGDVASYGKYVLKIEKPVYYSDVSGVNVRHILIAPEVEEGAEATSATPEQWAAALAKAQEVSNNWTAQGGTEDVFATLANENSSDTASIQDGKGGLMENVYPSQTVNEFNNWIFSDRKSGDNEIVKSDYGYHIIYFVSDSSSPYWKEVSATELASKAKESKLSGSIESFEVKINWLGSKFFVDDVSLAS